MLSVKLPRFIYLVSRLLASLPSSRLRKKQIRTVVEVFANSPILKLSDVTDT